MSDLSSLQPWQVHNQGDNVIVEFRVMGLRVRMFTMSLIVLGVAAVALVMWLLPLWLMIPVLVAIAIYLIGVCWMILKINQADPTGVLHEQTQIGAWVGTARTPYITNYDAIDIGASADYITNY